MSLLFTLKAMNKRFSKILAVVLIFTALSSNVAYAKQYTYDTCVEELPITLEWRSLEFSAFLEVHFQSKANNSDLIPTAINTYREYKNEILNELSKYKTGLFDTATQLEKLDACIRIADLYVERGKTMLKQHVSATAKVKQSTILLEKYKAINEKLGEMNSLIAKILGAFETLKNKFPGYLRDCSN